MGSFCLALQRAPIGTASVLILSAGFASLFICTANIALAADSKGTIPQSCAAHDVAILNLIEQNGEAGTISGQVLHDSFFEQIKARHACGEGRVDDAVIIYRGIVLKLAGGQRLGHPAD